MGADPHDEREHHQDEHTLQDQGGEVGDSAVELRPGPPSSRARFASPRKPDASRPSGVVSRAAGRSGTVAAFLTIMTDAREAWAVRELGFPFYGTPGEQLEHLVRYAILAPSTHNTQPWRFVVGEGFVEVHVDRARWLQIADPTQRELFVSVGCAVENLLVAAQHLGFGADFDCMPDPTAPTLALRVRLSPALRLAEEPERARFAAITSRRTSHGLFAATPIHDTKLAELRAAVGDEVRLFLGTDAEFLQAIDYETMHADAVLFADVRWREELAGCLGTGAFGQPWLIAKLSALAVRHLSLGRTASHTDHEVLSSAPVFGIISAVRGDPTGFLDAGRAFERLWLTAESLDLRLQPMNQILQVERGREELARLLPPSEFVPAVAFRMGYGKVEPEPTPRRPFGEMVTRA